MGMIPTSIKQRTVTRGSGPLNRANMEYGASGDDTIIDYQLDGYFKIAAIKIKENSVPEATSNPIIQRDLEENSATTDKNSIPRAGPGPSGKSIKTLPESSTKPSSYTFSPEEGDEASKLPQTWSKEFDKKKDHQMSQGPLVEKLEAMREKYKHVCMNRDELLKKNIALTNDLKKTQAQKNLRTKEAQKLVRHSQRESAQWKEFATAAQNENTVLIPEVDKLRSKLEAIDPENLEIVMRYQDLVKRLKECQSELGKERDHRKRLEQIKAEIEIELEQEKVTAMFNAEALEADFKSKRQNAESYNTSLVQRLEGQKLYLDSSKLGLETAKNCGQIRRWLVESGEKEKKPTELVRHGRRRASISRASTESTGSIRSSQKILGRKDENAQDDLSVALNRIMGQAENEQKKFKSLLDQYQEVIKERDDAVKELASLQRRAEEEFSNVDLQNQENNSGDDSQALIGPDFSDSRSQMQQLQKSPRRRSSGTLVAKIEILQMEVRQKSRMIQYLERENADQLGNAIYYQDPSRPLKKWEHTRYEIFKPLGMDMGDNLESGEVSSDADEEQMLGAERDVGSWSALLQPEPGANRSRDDALSVY